MAEVIYTFCDRCSPDSSVGVKISQRSARGWAEWSEEHCILELGWERRPEGVICPDCIDDEPQERTRG